MAMWANQPLKAYHGCDDVSARRLVPANGGHGIVLALGSRTTDFGQGFYTTTNVHQAQQWVNRRFHIGRRRGAKSATVVEFMIDRDAMAGLGHMAFVREDLAPNSDYWQFVSHCRSGNSHGRATKPYYDVVYGPVSLFPQFLVIADADQISFHTDEALRILSDVNIRSHGNPVY